MKYIRKNPFEWLKNNLESSRILLLLGPRQVGKTTLLKQFKDYAESLGQKSHFFSLEDLSMRSLLNADPKNIFQIIGNLPNVMDAKILLCIDEIQYLDNPSNFLKYLYDMHNEQIKIVVTGSSAFYINQKFTDSLAGRKFIYEMMSLDFSEFLDFKDYKGSYPGSNNLNILEKDLLKSYYYEYLTYGGYPSVVLAKSSTERKEILKELVESYTKKDVLDYEVSSQENYLRILKLLALQVGGLLNVETVSNNLGIPKTTVKTYLDIMNRSYHISTMAPWYHNKKLELKKMPKVFFLDLGLKNYLAGNFDPYDSRIDKGQVLENVVYLRLLAKYGKEEIYFWRNTRKVEVDFVIPKENLAYEVKQSLNGLSKSDYSVFTEEYKDIDFEFIDLDGSLEL